MPYSGRDPDSRSINRNPKVEWTPVKDVPFDAQKAGRGLTTERQWHPDTVRWWNVVSTLPHAILWREGDWQALFDLALLKNRQYLGSASASEITEIRQRESLFGTTSDALIKLRIRYEPVIAEVPSTPDEPPVSSEGVVPITSARSSMRDRLREA